MKVGFYNQDNGDTISEWELNPSQERFMSTGRKFVLFSGGVGCVSGDTKILDADTLEEKEIRNVHAPFRVFSHNGRKAWAMTPVKYDKAPLYKIKTDSYEFTGTA